MEPSAAVFVVLRFDLFHRPEAPLQEKVTAKGVFLDQGLAERELVRLNAINTEKGCVYVLQRTKILRLATPSLQEDVPLSFDPDDYPLY